MAIAVVIKRIPAAVGIDFEIGPETVHAQVGEGAVAETLQKIHIAGAATRHDEVQMTVLIEVARRQGVGVVVAQAGCDQICFDEGPVAIGKKNLDHAARVRRPGNVLAAIFVEIPCHHAAAVIIIAVAPVLHLGREGAIAVAPIKHHVRIVPVDHEIQVAVAVEVADGHIHDVAVLDPGNLRQGHARRERAVADAFEEEGNQRIAVGIGGDHVEDAVAVEVSQPQAAVIASEISDLSGGSETAIGLNGVGLDVIEHIDTAGIVADRRDLVARQIHERKNGRKIARSVRGLDADVRRLVGVEGKLVGQGRAQQVGDQHAIQEDRVLRHADVIGRRVPSHRDARRRRELELRADAVGPGGRIGIHQAGGKFARPEELGMIGCRHVPDLDHGPRLGLAGKDGLPVDQVGAGLDDVNDGIGAALQLQLESDVLPRERRIGFDQFQGGLAGQQVQQRHGGHQPSQTEQNRGFQIWFHGRILRSKWLMAPAYCRVAHNSNCELGGATRVRL